MLIFQSWAGVPTLEQANFMNFQSFCIIIFLKSIYFFQFVQKWSFQQRIRKRGKTYTLERHNWENFLSYIHIFNYIIILKTFWKSCRGKNVQTMFLQCVVISIGYPIEIHRELSEICTVSYDIQWIFRKFDVNCKYLPKMSR